MLKIKYGFKLKKKNKRICKGASARIGHTVLTIKEEPGRVQTMCSVPSCWHFNPTLPPPTSATFDKAQYNQTQLGGVGQVGL
jgi:hypothetical protein